MGQALCKRSFTKSKDRFFSILNGHFRPGGQRFSHSPGGGHEFARGYNAIDQAHLTGLPGSDVKAFSLGVQFQI